ncbi:ABC transporter substrate-binding protein [Litoreibacter sp.]|nr:ABC transporter substrate-binding protein [Litoreibacter sp.]
MKTIASTFGGFAVVAAFALPSQAAADCGEITITDMDWASAALITSVSSFLMENGYGCQVTKIPSSTVPALTSISETGKPDIATEIWVNSAPEIYAKLTEAGKIVTATSVLEDGGVEAWWIPDYLAKEHPELTTISGILANPELVGGRFHNCPEGWGCRVVNDNLKVALGLEDTGLEVFDHGSGETLATSIGAAFADKQPWFGYYWAPTAILGKYPMVQVDIGEFNADIHTCNADSGCETPGISAYPAASVVTIVTSDLAKDRPEIFELMSNVSFSNETMNTILAWREDNNATADEAAVYFLTNYPDVWKDWINKNAQEKLSALLK